MSLNDRNIKQAPLPYTINLTIFVAKENLPYNIEQKPFLGLRQPVSNKEIKIFRQQEAVLFL
jgi:hypothetical protein